MPRARRLAFKASTTGLRRGMRPTGSESATSHAPIALQQRPAQGAGELTTTEGPMLSTKPVSATELCEAVRLNRACDTRALNRILAIDAARGLLEVQAATPWQAIAAELRPGEPRAAAVRTTMATVGESIERNAAGPDGLPAVGHVASLTLVTPAGEMQRVSRH